MIPGRKELLPETVRTARDVEKIYKATLRDVARVTELTRVRRGHARLP